MNNEICYVVGATFATKIKKDTDVVTVKELKLLFQKGDYK